MVEKMYTEEELILGMNRTALMFIGCTMTTLIKLVL
jgi:hypothetical protein